MYYYNDKISTEPAAFDEEKGIYYCSTCNSKLQYVYDYYYDHLCRLQCPIHREHCNPKNDIPLIEAEMKYEQHIINTHRCKVCNFIFHYDTTKHSLVCPVHTFHSKPIRISKDEATKLGYRLYDTEVTTAKKYMRLD